MQLQSIVHDLLGRWAGEVGADRRIEPRVAANISARIKGLNPLTSTGPSHPATLVEVSQRGLGIRVDREFLPGASVQVLVGKEAFVGKVLHCSRSGNEFVIGLVLRAGILG